MFDHCAMVGLGDGLQGEGMYWLFRMQCVFNKVTGEVRIQ